MRASELWQQFFDQLQTHFPGIYLLLMEEWKSGRMQVWHTDYINRLFVEDKSVPRVKGERVGYFPVKTLVRFDSPVRWTYLALLRAGL